MCFLTTICKLDIDQALPHYTVNISSTVSPCFCCHSRNGDFLVSTLIYIYICIYICIYMCIYIYTRYPIAYIRYIYKRLYRILLVAGLPNWYHGPSHAALGGGPPCKTAKIGNHPPKMVQASKIIGHIVSMYPMQQSRSDVDGVLHRNAMQLGLIIVEGGLHRLHHWASWMSLEKLQQFWAVLLGKAEYADRSPFGVVYLTVTI